MRIDPHPSVGRTLFPGEARGERCFANIGAVGQWRRLRFGLIAWGIGAVAMAVLVALGADWWLRLPLFLPFVAGSTGFFQARDRT